ncbi:carboxylesterase family protein, partial [Streptomyces sp. SID7760]|nr:carboxylesterase family protein [Streptomyces sp. SID7760]
TLALARARSGKDRAAVRALRAALPGAGAGELAGQLLTDRLLRDPLRRLAGTRRPAPSFLYEFGWPSGVPGLGACHALELGFVFDTLDVPESSWLAGPDAPQELADRMHAAWVRFAATGDPGWRAWDGNGPPMVFGGPGRGESVAVGVTPPVLP